MTSLPSIRLSDLAAEVLQVIEQSFASKSYWVIADVTNHTFKQQSNYHYFELVEKDAASNNVVVKFPARAWGTGSQKIAQFEKLTGQRFGNDINVLVNVSVEYHATYGLRLSVTGIDPNFTLGLLEQQRQETLNRLVREYPDHIQLIDGRYITYNSRLRLNRVIQRIAILSSSTSAGFQDFTHTLENNNHAYRFLTDHYVVMVHGENNARQFVDKIVEVYHSGIAYDAMVIIRGGGAQTDFLLFNDYTVGRAIARFPIPVITGIGHQKNETIADLMAHTSTKTPTQAAEFIIAHNRKFEEDLLGLQKRLVIKLQQTISGQSRALALLHSLTVNYIRNYLDDKNELLNRQNQLITGHSKSLLFKHRSILHNLSSLVSANPRMIIYNRKADLKNICSNLSTFNGLYLKNRQSELNHYVSVIRMMAPENIMKKGFAVIKAKGRITSSADGIEKGEDIVILFAKKEIKAKVESKENYGGTELNL
ncbi:exodeoxyribonuclease VII large subunit [Arcticibacter tournemirensis]|uniref:Exodeoxyribonuclease 7 large subunit n=1 Tax=Arcticibacter tournemirensis TaxID=699437 RepID=A0A5M9HHZ1_9SPHI|nr:exodeoxyribonuclease VII large subunit [Arcticibacter tournemirensis]KAA8485014.1 exodeoxyribonuclease VII large subunit [Arcticibacter tournemirensis]TQM50532.1 exodeoxyribonuclease VII large subunit [Arcticibacter tournemirensis]